MSRMPASLRISVFLALFSPLFALAQSETPTYVLVSAPFFVDKPTEIPGHTLKPGSYSIRILDNLKDRYILRVDDTEGKPLATFIGLRNPEFEPFTALHQQGAIFWTSSPRGSTAVRGFSFPNGNTLEFAYPKDEAVALAKLNSYSVPAIDPESEGRKPDPNLTPEDREIVTLWMLKATRVGSGEEAQPAIEARRFEAEPAPPPARQDLAGNQGEPGAAHARNTAPAAETSAQPNLAQADVPPRPGSSQSRSRTVVKRLPQTASQLPLLFLISFLLLSTAGSIGVVRRVS